MIENKTKLQKFFFFSNHTLIYNTNSNTHMTQHYMAMTLFKKYPEGFPYLSPDVASESGITPCNKIEKKTSC